MMSELIQYHIVNKDLSMSKGKIAAQVGHASTISAMMFGDEDNFIEWYGKGFKQKKVILSGREKDLLKILRELDNCVQVYDNGHNEIPVGSLTVVALPPMTKENAKQYVKRLQTLKD